MRNIIGFLTKTLFYFGIGRIVCYRNYSKSSSATTVMVVGFVNAGLMNLNQAIGIIMGANVGTTVTAQLVSFDFEALRRLQLESVLFL